MRALGAIAHRPGPPCLRALLRAEVEVLEESHDRLADLAAVIPPSPEETSEEDLHGPFDFATEVRTVLAIGVRDNLNPLLKSLRAAAEYQPAAPRASSKVALPEPIRLDLTADEKTIQPLIYALVVKDNFTACFRRPTVSIHAPAARRRSRKRF